LLQVTRFVILINCGAAEDMSALLELADRPHVCLVIIDSCRPIDTIFNDENPDSNVYVLLDERAEGISKADIPFPESGEFYCCWGSSIYASRAAR
jgi:hypothetical protein